MMHLPITNSRAHERRRVSTPCAAILAVSTASALALFGAGCLVDNAGARAGLGAGLATRQTLNRPLAYRGREKNAGSWRQRRARDVIVPRVRWENKFVYSDIPPSQVRRQVSSPRRLVVCLDSSEASVHALNYCINKLFAKGDEVQLLHVFEHEPLRSASLDPLPSTVSVAMESVGFANMELEARGEQEAVRMMKRHQQRCIDAGVMDKSPSITVMRGKSCNNEICKYAEDHGADMLVIASRGLGAVKRFLLGSVSGYCVHNCKVPVLVVREEAKQLNAVSSYSEESSEAGLKSLGAAM